MGLIHGGGGGGILIIDNIDFVPQASSSNVWERVSVGQNKSFQSLGTQHGRHVIKAHDLKT